MCNLWCTFQYQSQLSKFIQTFQLQPELSNCGVTFQLKRNFPTSKEAFQLRSVLSNFNRFISISLGSFQLQRNFPTSRSFQRPFPTTHIPKNHPKNQTYDQDCLDFVSRNDARWHTQNKFFEIFLDFVSENDARWRTQFLDFVSEICQYGLTISPLELSWYN